MATLVFRAPNGERIENPATTLIQSVVLDPSRDYWRQGSGDATIDFSDGNHRKRLLVLPNDLLFFYLKYIEGTETWLSLQDADRLGEVIECSDEWYASVGLFLPRERAWLAIKDFCDTGRRCNDIQWIRPVDLPEGGNW